MAKKQIAENDSYLRSSFIESLVEHVFISEILQEVFYTFGMTVEVLRCEVDSSGYDVVLECNDVVRHVQLKTSKEHAKTPSQKVHLALARKSGGCVVWIRRHEDVEARRMRFSYLFFGGMPGQPLPPVEGYHVAKHTKRDSQGIRGVRRALRVVPKRMFQKIDTTKELVERLFGIPQAV